MAELVLPRIEIFESITETHNRGTPTPKHHKQLNDTFSALEGNAAGVDASLDSLNALTAELEVVTEDLGEVVNEQADIIAEQVALNDTQNDQALEIIDILEEQVEFSIDLAAQAADIIDALDLAFQAIEDAQDVDDRLDLVDNALRELIKDRIGYQATITATPGVGGIYAGSWVSTGAFPVGESVSSNLSFAVAKGANGVQAKLVSVTSSTFELYLFDAAGPVTTGSYSVFIAFRSAPAA